MRRGALENVLVVAAAGTPLICGVLGYVRMLRVILVGFGAVRTQSLLVFGQPVAHPLHIVFGG